LFLIADTGAGHRSAANAITNAITLISQKEQDEWRLRQSVTDNGTVHSSIPGQAGNNALAPLPPSPYRIEIVGVFEEDNGFALREAIKLYRPTLRYNPNLVGQVLDRTNRE